MYRAGERRASPRARPNNRRKAEVSESYSMACSSVIAQPLAQVSGYPRRVSTEKCELAIEVHEAGFCGERRLPLGELLAEFG
jgi:hypothetical protein